MPIESIFDRGDIWFLLSVPESIPRHFSSGRSDVFRVASPATPVGFKDIYEANNVFLVNFKVNTFILLLSKRKNTCRSFLVEEENLYDLKGY